MTEARHARLYAIAVTNARKPWGTGWDMLSGALQRACILAEVTTIIGAQDSDAAGAAMIGLAEYAVKQTANL